MKKIQTITRLVWVTSNVEGGPERYARLEVHDKASSMLVLQADMTAEDFASFMSSSSAYVDAIVQDDDRYHRVGKKMITHSEHFGHPHEWWQVSSVTAEMQAYADNYVSAGSWDSADWRQQNDGWRLVMHRWVEQ